MGNEHSSQSSYLSGAISGFEEEKLDGKDGYAKGSAVIHTKQDRDSIVVTRKYRIWVDLNENGNEHAKLIQDWDKRNNEFVDNSRIETHYNAE